MVERHRYVLDPGYYADGASVARCRFCLSDNGHFKTDCFTKRKALMNIFAADDPLVLNGTYDREGYKPGERARIAKARARQQKESSPMAKRKKANGTNGTGRKPGRPRQPRQPDLIEDRAIKPLEDVANAYADLRDQRMVLTKEEAELKQTAIQLMKKFDKTIYRHNGIEIRIVPGQDDVKVKVKKPGEDDEEDDAAGDSAAISADAEAGQ